MGRPFQRMSLLLYSLSATPTVRGTSAGSGFGPELSYATELATKMTRTGRGLQRNYPAPQHALTKLRR